MSQHKATSADCSSAARARLSVLVRRRALFFSLGLKLSPLMLMVVEWCSRPARVAFGRRLASPVQFPLNLHARDRLSLAAAYRHDYGELHALNWNVEESEEVTRVSL
jgi:hypothetical protein